LSHDGWNVIEKSSERSQLLSDIVRNLSEVTSGALTGADLYAFTSESVQVALSRTITRLEKEMEDKGSAKLIVTKDDFNIAAKLLVPSVSEEDLIHYENLASNHFNQ